MTGTDEIDRRLRDALDHWGEGVMAFVDAMKEELEGTGVQGATYPAIKRYMDGEATPSVEFLERASAVLGVRPEWLVLDSGGMTEAEARAREDVEGVSRSAVEAASDALRLHGTMELQRRVLLALGRGHPPVPEPPEELETIGDLGGDSDAAVRWREAVQRSFRSRRIHPWAAPLAEAHRRLDVGSGTTLDDPVRFPLGVHERVSPADLGAALRGPLEALDLDPGLMSVEALDEYVLAALPALLSLAPERRRQVDRRVRAAGESLDDENDDQKE